MKKVLSILICISIILSGLCMTVAAEGNDKLLPAVELQNNVEKWGYINTQGKFVIKPQYESASDFNDNGIAMVSKSNSIYEMSEISFINKAGATVSGPFKANMPVFGNVVTIINGSAGQSWVIDRNGKLLFSSKHILFEYSDTLLAFREDGSEKGLYGLMDLTGKAVVAATYSNINEYNGNLAKKDRSYPYYDEKLKKYGYKAQDGSVLIKPVFNLAEDFKDGFAIVNVETKEYIPKCGLINAKGEYVIKPDYSGIKALGQGLYAVSRGDGFMSNDMHLPKALFNSEGFQLTDFKYYMINDFNGDYGAVSDNTTSFFIDKKGKVVEDLPKLEGVGTMTLKDGIIKAALDNGLQYIAKDGSTIWKKNEVFELGNGLNVRTMKYRKDFITYAAYPAIEGLSGATVQDGVNKKLKELFTADLANQKASKEEENIESKDVNFTVQRNANLLIIEKSAYYYPIGAAHGQPYRHYYYVDLKTGAFYEMKDLFKSGSKYAEKLTSLVKQEHSIDNRVYTVLSDEGRFLEQPTVYDKQCYLIGEDSIKFIYQPYEIAAYAYGFPEIELTYGQMEGLINKDGAFWKSFDKKIINRRVEIIRNFEDSVVIDDKLVNAFSALIGSYENKLIEAVNTNSFAKVEPYLLKGSSLYSSQLKLVKDLYKKKTKEKLVSYQIYTVAYDNSKMEFKVFVTENIAIKQTGKAYVSKKSDWCYSVKLDSASKTYRLCSITKW